MVIVAVLDTFAVASLTVYETGVGSFVKPACGVKVTSPRLLSAVQTPWPGTVKVLPSGLSVDPGGGLTNFTVLGSRSRLGSVSLLVTFSVTGPAGLCSELSLTATGGWAAAPGVRVMVA